jgi:DNA-binding GntR family transcriptional regulator
VESDKIYQSLKKKIIWLDLMPETILNLSELADSFKVSRTPIKEVLILLQAEGWVLRNGPYFMVMPLSLERIKEITEIRSVMEVQATIWAMSRITADELSVLDDLKGQILSLGESSPNKQMIELDLQFHRVLYQATKNGQLAQLLDHLLSHYLRFWLSISLKKGPKWFFKDNLEMIQAIREKDEARLAMLASHHIKSSVDEIMGSF